jgi:G:T/U-mismatch repair DNA glycosylase
VKAALLDVDGTLVDTNYHHALAWYRAFRDNGFALPVWRIHRHVGMGGDQLVPALVGERLDADKGEAIRNSRDEIYEELIDEVAPLEGARELIEDLNERGFATVLASSSPKRRSATTSISWTPVSWPMRGRRMTTSRRPSPSQTRSAQRSRRRGPTTLSWSATPRGTSKPRAKPESGR